MRAKRSKHQKTRGSGHVLAPVGEVGREFTRRYKKNSCLMALAGGLEAGKRTYREYGEKESKLLWLNALVRLRVGNRSMNASPSPSFPLHVHVFVIYQWQWRIQQGRDRVDRR
jgi:hypothetical protein